MSKNLNIYKNNRVVLGATEMNIHPRSRNFAWKDAPTTGTKRLTSQQIHDFNGRGFFVLPSVFSPEEIKAVTAAIDPLEKIFDDDLRAQGGQLRLSKTDAITFTTHIVAKSPVLRAFADHPVYRDICHDLIGPASRLYWDQSVYKKSGIAQEFPWHQDNGYTFIEPEQYVTCWTPLVDVDEDNGCPWIAPGLHRQGTLEHWETDIGLKCLETVDGAVSAPAKAGDVIVFSSLAPHRTGPNLKSGTIRKAYILQYAPDGALAYPRAGGVVEQRDPDRQFLISSPGASAQ